MGRGVSLWIACLLVLAVAAGCRRSERAITSPDEAKDARIGVMIGTTGEAIARKRFPEARVKSFDDIMDAVAAMKSGQLDVIITAYPTSLQVVKKNPELGRLPHPLSNEDTAIALRKGNDELLAALNRIITELKNDGTLEEMRKRWFKEDLSPYRERDYPVPRDGEVLRIGVSATREPFSFVDKDGRVTGHDGELARIIGARLRRPVEFSNMKYMALIPALQAGKVDIIVAGMTATDERRKTVDFTIPYFANAQVMLVRKGAQEIRAAARRDDAGVPSPSFLTRLATSFHSNIIRENRYLLIWDGLKTTVVISVLATFFGTLLGALVCFMRMSRTPLLRLPARVYIAVLRGTPVLVVLMLIFYVVFASVDISPVLVAVIAFGLNFAAYAAEIYRSGVESIEKGQAEAGIAMGFTRVRTFQYIVLPQTVRRILPVYKGELISLVKMTSIVGYIAVQDLTKASDIIRSRTFDAFFPLVMVAVLYFLISWLLMQSLGYLERRTDPEFRTGRMKDR